LVLIAGSLAASATAGPAEAMALAGPAVLLPLGAGLLVSSALRYGRRYALRPGLAWLSLRLATGIAAGLLAAASLANGAAIAPAAGAALVMGAAATLLRPDVRRLVFGGQQHSVEQRDEAG